MNRLKLLSSFLAAAIAFAYAPAYSQTTGDQPVNPPAQVQHGPGFVDQNGDGYNDNAPDQDGDGIPNGQDSDYAPVGTQQGQGHMAFIDADGDGVNDIPGDFDGDGIPNGQDPDFQPGQQQAAHRMQNFVDNDGDGINDNTMSRIHARRGNAVMAGGQQGYGPKDGTGLQPRPQDGTGYGPGAGTANCDGTGPKGAANRGSQRPQSGATPSNGQGQQAGSGSQVGRNR